jgi:hypothetical protein
MSRLGVLAVVGAFGLAAPAAALAQWNWDAPGYREGYTRGERAGAEDARRRQSFNYDDESDYRRGDYGYRSQYGNRDRYRDTFRYGYQEGYRYGYSPWSGARGGRGGVVPPWSAGGARGGYRYDPAYQTGMNDGYEAGLDDGRDGRRYDPVSERRYRGADRGYEREYGPREAYKNQYREAFKVGYARGFADGRRYDDRRRGWGSIFGFRF